MTGDPPRRARPLLVTSDPALLDDLLHLAAVTGVEARVAPDIAAARDGWAAATCVVLGADVCSSAALVGLPPRAGVVVASSPGHDRGPASLASLGRATVDDVVAMATRLGATLVALPRDRDTVAAVLASGGGQSRAIVIAVTGGRGGAGASTLACALAATAGARGRRTMLVDADPLGGGIELALGAEQSAGLRWADLGSLHGPVAQDVLVDALPQAHGLTLLSHDRTSLGEVGPAAMTAVLEAAGGCHDLVVADVCRAPDPAGEVVLARADLVVLVVPAEVRATAAATRQVARLAPLAADVRVVVRGPAPSGLTGAAVAGLLGLPLLGWLRPESGVVVALERGEPPTRQGRGPLCDLARIVLRAAGVLGRPPGRAAA